MRPHSTNERYIMSKETPDVTTLEPKKTLRDRLSNPKIRTRVVVALAGVAAVVVVANKLKNDVDISLGGEATIETPSTETTVKKKA